MDVESLVIAHISDLHRSSDNPISNVSLLNSLIQDREKYTLKGIPTPELMIVSGDIVQGSDSDNVTREQYQEAHEFLEMFANEFFDGDKSRIIIVPGNHDISWTESQLSMEKIEEKEVSDETGRLKNDIFRMAVKINSDVKWSWPDRSFYRIKDLQTYQQRLSYFSEFYQNFYQGNRQYSLDPSQQYEIFDFPELGVAIVGFNSCFHNDHLNRAGAINPDCIALAGIELRKLKKQGRLLLAVWHHNTKGAPYDQDYMDDTFIKNLIDCNVKIGFHGHQHKHEILREVNNIIENRMLLILSAGSLCAGPSGLPHGYNQQYNILKLSRVKDDELKLSLYSRAKTPESTFDNPIWDVGSFAPSVTEFSTSFRHETNTTSNLGTVEKLIGEKSYQKALKALIKHDTEDPVVRTLLLECLEKVEDYSLILDYFSTPRNNKEAIALLNAALECGDSDIKKRIITEKFIAQSVDPSVKHLREQISLKGKIR